MGVRLYNHKISFGHTGCGTTLGGLWCSDQHFGCGHGQYLLSGSMIVCLVVIPNFRVIARSNQATARMLGLTALDKLLATADEVLELLQPVHVVCRGA